MAIVFVPVVMPSNLSGQANGKLGPCHLRPVYFPGVGHLSLQHQAADAFECLTIACELATGYKLSSTGCYRSYEQQENVFRQRYTETYVPVRNTLNSKRTWRGHTWYLRRGMFPVAVPGTSNHGWGLANDLAIFVGGKVAHVQSIPKVWNWLSGPDGAMTFGLSWEGARPGEPGWEAHHLRYVTGDSIPTRVRDMKAWFAAHAGQAAA